MDLTYKATIFLQEKLYYLQKVSNIARFYPFLLPTFCIEHVISEFVPEWLDAQPQDPPFLEGGSSPGP